MASIVECSKTKYNKSDRKVVRSAPGRLHEEKRGGGVANNNIININIMSCQIRTAPGRLHQEKRGGGVINV